MNNDFFEIDVNKLYEKAKRDVLIFIRAPIEDHLFNALFALYHLREWIYPDGYESYKNKNLNDMTSNEHFHNNLHTNPDYVIIRQLCNRAKHVKVDSTSFETNLKQGLIPGYARAGDSLGQKVFLVENRDVRTVMENVLEEYNSYFNMQ